MNINFVGCLVFDFSSAVLCMSRYHCIWFVFNLFISKRMEYIDKWMRSGFLNKIFFFSFSFIIALIWIDEHVQLSILSRELILMLIWYHSDTFYTVGHRSNSENMFVCVCVSFIKRSHGFFVRKIWSQIQNKL